MGAEIKYNGMTLAELEDGQVATLDCAGKKMLGDVVVSTTAGGGGAFYDGDITLYAAAETGTFTISCDGETRTYTYVEGMTWGDWVESSFNTDDYGFVDIDGNETEYMWYGTYFIGLKKTDAVTNGDYYGVEQYSL